jgi:hypothetical protein
MALDTGQRKHQKQTKDCQWPLLELLPERMGIAVHRSLSPKVESKVFVVGLCRRVAKTIRLNRLRQRKNINASEERWEHRLQCRIDSVGPRHQIQNFTS